MASTITGRLRFVIRYVNANVFGPIYVTRSSGNKQEVKILQQEHKDVDTGKTFWLDVPIESESV